jgi:hypothetical protein
MNNKDKSTINKDTLIKIIIKTKSNLNISKLRRNEKFILEYSQAAKEGHIYTDHTKTHTDNHKKYFTKEVFDKLNLIRHQINVTPLNAPFEFDHLLYYFRDKEYDVSYFEIVGETHCIFNLKHGFFTEKSLKPILSEKFALIFGSNKVYKEFKRIGIDLFLDEFGLNGIEDKNELEQIDMIIGFLKNSLITFLFLV